MWPFEYPYTNFHELNLDWIISRLKAIENYHPINQEENKSYIIQINAVKEDGTKTTAAEINKIIDEAENFSYIFLNGDFAIDETIIINHKNNFTIAGLGGCCFTATSLPVIKAIDSEKLNVRGITIKTSTDPGAGAFDQNKYPFIATGNTFSNFSEIRIIGRRYGFYMLENVNCSFEKMLFHVASQANIGDSVTDAVSFTLGEGNVSSRFVKCASSYMNKRGCGYFLFGDNTRDLIFDSCETDNTRFGIFIDCATSQYLNNIRFNNCLLDAIGFTAIHVKSNENGMPNIVFNSCYVWCNPAGANVADITGSGLIFENCEFHEGLINADGTGNISFKGCRLFNCRTTLNSYKSLYMCGNTNSFTSEASGYLLNGVSGCIIGDSFKNESSAQMEWDINTNSGMAHSLYIAGVHSYGAFIHHYFTQAAETDVV